MILSADFSEVQPLETRSAGQSITTLVNLMFSFVIGQARHTLQQFILYFQLTNDIYSRQRVASLKCST